MPSSDKKGAPTKYIQIPLKPESDIFFWSPSLLKIEYIGQGIVIYIFKFKFN